MPLSKRDRERMKHLESIKLPPKFSYSAKEITLVASIDIGQYKTKVPAKKKRQVVNRAIELAEAIPFDWTIELAASDKPGSQIAVFFGFDTYQEALAGQKRLQESGFDVKLWDKEEGNRLLAMALKQAEAKGYEVGPITDQDSGEEVDFDWRNYSPKSN
jgi:hypothetical protein